MMVIALLSSGFIYRTESLRQQSITGQANPSEFPLKQFPLKINNWQGEDVDNGKTIEESTHCDDFLFRLYRNTETNQSVNVYITYHSQPRTMLGHRPEICFTASGWNNKNTDKVTLVTTSGEIIGCTKYLFTKNTPTEDEMTVVGFYILNGKLTDDYREFSGIKWRTLTSPKEQARYVTQIQISSTSEEAAVSAAKEMSDLLIDLFPEARK